MRGNSGGCPHSLPSSSGKCSPVCHVVGGLHRRSQPQIEVECQGAPQHHAVFGSWRACLEGGRLHPATHKASDEVRVMDESGKMGTHQCEPFPIESHSMRGGPSGTQAQDGAHARWCRRPHKTLIQCASLRPLARHHDFHPSNLLPSAKVPGWHPLAAADVGRRHMKHATPSKPSKEDPRRHPPSTQRIG